MTQGTRPPQRRDRLIGSPRHDPYRARSKPTEPTVCSECGATFREGRWTWAAGPADAPRQLCPACQRIRDDYPAGYVTLEGGFLAGHEQDILGLVRNLEERSKKEHPLNRIIEIRTEEQGRIEITTTDTHLARRIGEALHNAYQGELEFRYSDGEMLLRASWRR
jgi:NMD protein affecting ribosome stability and mRNA decay